MGDIWSSNDPVPGVAGSEIKCGNLTSWSPEAEGAGDGLICCNRQGLIGAMISGCIHEINNPNNNILLASRLLGDYWKEIAPLLSEYHGQHQDACCAGVPLAGILDSMPRIIAMIAEDVGRISRITSQLKSNASSVASDSSGCDPNAVLRAVAESLKGMIAKHTRQFRLELSEDLPLITIDNQLMHQVAANLVCNALQSLPARERAVMVSSRRDDQSGQIVISVEDQGCGIASHHLNRVFEPFFTINPEHGRAGLGLFVSRLIIQRNHGTLTLSSVPEQGSIAVVRLPCR